MKTLKLRTYQTQAIDALHEAWDRGVKRPAVVLPTGMGKTVIFAELIRQCIAAGKTPMVLVHRDELARQTVNKIEDAAPGVGVGVIKAERHEMHGVDVIVASVATLGRQARLDRTPAGLADIVIVDECHHSNADSYLRILKHFGCFDPASPAVACGFTATMQRGDDRHLGQVWQEVVYRKDIMYGILHGHLVGVRGKTVRLDLGDVAFSKGDYQEGSLGDALEEAGAPKSAALAYHEYATRPDGTLRKGIIFAPTVESARSFAAQFNAAGIITEVVTGDTPTEDRQLIYKRVRSGETTVLASCMVLTEGFDEPELEVAVIARMTAKAGLYVQMAGRVLRPAPWAGKTEALIIDVVGVTERHALASIADLTEGRVTPKEGESLTEAAERQESEGAAAGKVHRASKTGDIDLFKRSSSAWLRTNGGRWFIPTRVCTVFLWEGEEGFKVGRSSSNYAMRGDGAGWLVGGQSFPLDMAMAWAEQEAADIDPSVSSRNASWRTKRQPPSAAQAGQLAKRGIPFDVHTTKNEASDLLSISFASKLLDR